MFNPVQVGEGKRYSYDRTKEIMEMPHLLDLQRKSYAWFKEEGLAEIFRDVSPISDFSGKLELFFESFTFDEPKYSLEECKRRDGTYAAPLRVKVKLHNKEKGYVKEQTVFFGDFPLMTETGTFIINGAERVIVSQLVRSPGVYFDKTLDPAGARIFIPPLLFRTAAHGLNLKPIPISLYLFVLIGLGRCLLLIYCALWTLLLTNRFWICSMYTSLFILN